MHFIHKLTDAVDFSEDLVDNPVPRLAARAAPAAARLRDRVHLCGEVYGVAKIGYSE